MPHNLLLKDQESCWEVVELAKTLLVVGFDLSLKMTYWLDLLTPRVPPGIEPGWIPFLDIVEHLAQIDIVQCAGQLEIAHVALD